MNVNNMNSITMYSNIQYERLQTQRSYDTYVPHLSKSMNNKSNSTVRKSLFYINVETIFFCLQTVGQMTPITNISVASSTMTTPQSSLTYTPSGMLHKQQSLSELSMGKPPPSSTLVDLLKSRRSPPPSRTNNLSSTTTRQQKQNSIIKQPRKTTKKSQAEIKRLAANNNNNNIQVNFNS